MNEFVADLSFKVVFGASILLVLLAIVCLKIKILAPELKKILFSLIVLVIFCATFYLAFSTIYLNVTSSSGGPVHWHADFEIWNCGKEVDLKDPKGFSNRVGTPTLHEHGDKRIHMEGVVVERDDASLGKFFKVVGGEINPRFMIIPTNTGNLVLKNGETCPDVNGGLIPGEVQVFVYKVVGNNYTQTKLANPGSYNFSSQGQVPPGDCIIVEFDSPKDKTDKLCRSFVVAKQIGKLGGEI